MVTSRINRCLAYLNTSTALVCFLGFTGCVFDRSGLPHAGDAAVQPDGYQPFCGNGMIDQGEDCDGLEFGGATCISRGYTTGELACTALCVFNEVGCTQCGDDQQQGTEHCDGVDLAGESCESLSFDGGDLFCSPTCQFDTTHCTGSGCGDSTIDPGEDCEGANLNDETCDSLGQGFTGGTLICGSDCLFDTDGCYTCGDGIRTGAEQCDGADLNNFTCVSLAHDGGNLACYPGSCTFDVSNCSDCGNSVIEFGENCDGAELGGADCASVGFTAGTLACGTSCGFDFSGCTTCGNAVVETGEECDDGSTLNSNTTPDACREDCTTPICGDGVCDSTDMGGSCAGDCSVILFSDGFESNWPNGWSTGDNHPVLGGYDTWEAATNAAHTGSESCWCSGNGSASTTYDDYMQSWAAHSVDLSGAAGQTVYYDLWIWVDLSDSADFFSVIYNPDDGSGWTTLETINSDTGGWVLRSYDISAGAGNNNVEIGMYFESDYNNSSTHGAYVDDITVYYTY